MSISSLRKKLLNRFQNTDETSERQTPAPVNDLQQRLLNRIEKANSVVPSKETMDIENTYPWDMVRFSFPKNGSEKDQMKSIAYLTEGQQYQVDTIERNNYSTTIFLKEFPGKPFNSVMFSNVEPTNKPKF